ncbi:sugar porter family MFS transporter [Demequina pelophila]|uniref:sugar porter family MFS transporter n=1 Tax=Demequina pelophila TaxID=1638984 RepID=UPI0009E3AD2E|nr:sugar porter family MFS transporter [Demequina pelophila]
MHVATPSAPVDPNAPKPRLSRRVIAISLGAALGGFLFGFDSSVVNGAVEAMQHDFALDDAFTGIATAIALLACAFGAWFAGQIAEKFGRIRVMVISSIAFLISAIGSGLCMGVWDLMGWRIVGGLAIGAASVIAPAYIAEVAPSAFRGRLGSLQQLAIVAGMLASVVSDQAFAGSAGGASEVLWLGIEAWRWMFIAAALPALIYGGTSLMLPESPRYLVSRGQTRKAAQILADFTGEADPAGKVQQIRATMGEGEKRSLRDLTHPRYGLKPIVWIGIGLSVFQQFSGANAIFYYSVMLFKTVGFTESQSFWITTITNVTLVATTFIAIGLIDKVGRKALLVAGSIGMGLSLAAVAMSFAHATRDAAGDLSLTGIWAWTALIFANVFVLFYGATWGPVTWVLLGEMFPNRIRATALAVGAAAQWVANFAVTATFPALKGWSLVGTYSIYTVIVFVGLVFCLKYVPETKGRELEDMDDDPPAGGADSADEDAPAPALATA